MDEWVDRMKRMLLAVQQFGGETEPLVIAPPASEEEVAAVEAELGMAVPASFRKVLTEFSACVDLRWELPDPTGLPEELRRIGSGLLWWSVQAIAQMYDDYRGWVDEVFSDIADPYDKVWHGKFPALEVGNGDYIAISVEADQIGSVVYLSHEGDPVHGSHLADNFADFLDRYLALGCAGPDDWTLEVFLGEPDLGLQTECPTAKLWRACLYGSSPPEQTDLDAFQTHRVAARKKTVRERAVEILQTSSDPKERLSIYCSDAELALDAGIDEVYRELASLPQESVRQFVGALKAFCDPSTLDWIEENITDDVTMHWGALAAASRFS
jgi:hypothetical protein